MRISDRAASLPPFLAMEVLERAQERECAGERIVHLELGEPDFPAPACVLEAACEAMRAGHTHYTHSLGIRPLREAIAEHYLRRYGAAVSPERVIVTAGSSAGLILALAALLDPGDELLLTDPRYACYPNFARTLGIRPVSVPLDASDGYRLHAEAFSEARTPLVRAILVNSPANPTGAIQSRTTLEELAALGLPILSDEIYHRLEYGEEAPSILEITDQAVVLDGFSKRYAMTGWRLGWMVVPPDLVRPVRALQQNLFICAGSVAQWAGLAALQAAEADVAQMVAEYAVRRQLLLDGLRELGFGIPCEPHGAYYVLADARHLDRDSLRLSRRLLEEAGVGVTPGIDFGPCAEGFLRFSYASHRDQIQEGLERIRCWLSRQPGG